ncbi:MAG: DeoR family transcriptional regulator, partial [Alicyclobacillaceae bacterium]|nr:DeoR family transcriptional regulator [Alicyclobacillaceae bacterium]
MLPSERQSKILDWLQKEGHLKISELSRRLHVSEMTVHRDIRVLAEQGRVIKTYGGVSLATPTPGEPSIPMTTCALCGRPVHDRLSMTLNHRSGRPERFCCPHCGLLAFRQRPTESGSFLGRDFLLGHTVGSQVGWYVMDARIRTLCCEPQVLLFGERDDAERFIQGFGGNIWSFDEALEELQ